MTTHDYLVASAERNIEKSEIAIKEIHKAQQAGYITFDTAMVAESAIKMDIEKMKKFIG